MVITIYILSTKSHNCIVKVEYVQRKKEKKQLLYIKHFAWKKNPPKMKWLLL